MALTRRHFVGTAAAAAALGLPALAQPLPQDAPASALTNSDTLDAGTYEWHPELSPEGPVTIIVSLAEQRVHVYRNGVEIGISTCSTGKPGHETPTGVFLILQKDKDHHSSLYDDAPMPNMERLTWGGVALHAGNLPGYPASHGCIRLPLEFSKLLFGVTHLGVPVIVADEGAAPLTVVHPGFVLPQAASQEAYAALHEAAAKDHHATDATTQTDDVVSIVVSGADRAAVMFRDGQEVWRSPILIRGDGPLGSHVYKLLGVEPDSGHFTWLAHTVKVEEAGGASPEAVLSRFEVVDWSGAIELLGEFRPGSTLVVSDVAISRETLSDPDFVIIRDDVPTS